MLYKGGRQLRSIEVGKLLISREEGFDPACVPCFSFVTTVPYYSMGTARLLFTYTCHPGDHLAEVDLFYSVVGRDLSEK